MKRFKVLYIFALVACFAATASPQLVPHRVVLASAKSISLNLPADLEIVPAVEGLKRVRFFARSPDGRVFVNRTGNSALSSRPASTMGPSKQSRM